MKTVTPALLALINGAGGGNPLVFWDLYTLALPGGGLLTYTTAPFRIYAADSTVWNPPAIDGSGGLWSADLTWEPGVIDTGDTQAQGHWKVGLDSDQWQFKLAPRPFDLYSGAAFPDQIGSVPWLQAARAGALDNADVIVSRAFFGATPTHPIPVKGLSPVGTIILFRGIVGQIDFSTTAAFVTINDYKSLLGQQMPRNLYQASCRHRLFDARCTLSAASFTGTGAAADGSSQVNIVATVAAPGGSATYTLGTLSMTSGLNMGVSRMVANWDGSNFALLSPLPYAVEAGDTFSVTAGCDKTMSSCNSFSNINNFGANPYVPPPEVSIG